MSLTKTLIVKTEETTMQEQKDLLVAEGIHLEALYDKVEHGEVVTLNLDLSGDTEIEFIGIALGTLEITGNDKFLVEIPGFLEKNGVVCAVEAKEEGLESTLTAVFAKDEGESVLAGIGSVIQYCSSFKLHDNSLRAGYSFVNKLESGKHCFKIYLSTGSEPLQLLEDYGSYLKQFGRNKDTSIPTGWNSWDFYGAAISMKDMEEEMASVKELNCADSIKYATIDMGWEEVWGNWIPNRKFPETFKEIADKIKAQGFKPGIWVSPLQVSKFTQLARHRQDLFLRKPDGSLVSELSESPVGPILLFDYKKEEVRDLVGSWFKEMSDAGFELFKIDYVYSKFLQMQEESEGGINKVAFTHLIYETIRNAVGEDAHVINCGGRKDAAIGLVDSSRVSMDIHNFWGHIKNSAKQISNSFWMNHNLWVNDPDFAIVRTKDNSTTTELNMPYTKREWKEEKDFERRKGFLDGWPGIK
ncbi:MAG: alpha-amylase family protein [Planctomycetota bacterium]|jgi:hypothetical protein